MKPVIVVVGSLNMDFVVAVDELPTPGQTVLGRDFRMLPGGKGANQACAAGKLGARSTVTKMAGRVGYDVFADHLKASLAAAGVEVGAVRGTKSAPTGIALIQVERSGQNSIVVASGANHMFTPSEVESLRHVVHSSRFVLVQLETPLATVAAALTLARQEGVETMLDPAPAQELSPEILSAVDYLTPNESEASLLLGLPPARVTPEEAPKLAAMLRERGPRVVVLKLGEQGCFYSGPDGEMHVPGFPVAATDTTAAGDTFNAALAVALAEEKPLQDALRFANAAAGISVTRLGAQASVPTRAEVDAFLKDHPA